MANIVILGAGLGGMSAAHEIRSMLGRQHSVTVVGDGRVFNFTPSNPWVAVGWRRPRDIRLDVAGPLEGHGIRFVPVAAKKVVPEAKRVELVDGEHVGYDYLVVATGPRLAFERVPGTGPDGFTQSICTGPHAEKAWQAYQKFLADPGPILVGAGAGCELLRPRVRIRDDPGHRPAPAQAA